MNYYDEIANGYEELHKDEQLNKIEIIKKNLKPKQKDKLLDVGCGTGLTTTPWNCIRYGIDPAKKLIDRAQDKDKINYSIAQAEKIPYPDNYFDYVISITALQNFDDIEKGLSEIKRVGKKDFVLSFLKKSKKKEGILALIRSLFNIKNEIEENKDCIIFATKN